MSVEAAQLQRTITMPFSLLWNQVVHARAPIVQTGLICVVIQCAEPLVLGTYQQQRQIAALVQELPLAFRRCLT